MVAARSPCYYVHYETCITRSAIMYFHLKPSVNGQWFFTIVAGGNYKTLATSETYRNRSDALAAIHSIQGGAGGAEVVE
jgi:uncharacterized protein YegP (UPF0339 family)